MGSSPKHGITGITDCMFMDGLQPSDAEEHTLVYLQDECQTVRRSNLYLFYSTHADIRDNIPEDIQGRPDDKQERYLDKCVISSSLFNDQHKTWRR